MSHVVRVEFSGPCRMQYCSAAGATPALGDVVVVETEWGVGIGGVCAVLPSAVSDQLKVPVWTILRKATPTDLSRRAALLQREREARSFCRERILARGLPMKLTEVRIGLDSSKAMFYFTADGRVADFLHRWLGTETPEDKAKKLSAMAPYRGQTIELGNQPGSKPAIGKMSASSFRAPSKLCMESS